MVLAQQPGLPLEIASDEPELESSLHLEQIILLLKSLKWLWQQRTDFFAAGNLSIYYDPQQLQGKRFRGPDFFVVLDTQAKPRKSWVVWAENHRYPNLIVEILSQKTAKADPKADRSDKKQLYQDTFQTPEYFWFDPVSLEFEGFVLRAGQYQAMAADLQGRRWSEQLGLYLGLWANQLRYFTPAGEWVPTPEEAAEQERLRAEQERLRAEHERLRAEQAEARAERLAARLRALGLNPDELEP